MVISIGRSLLDGLGEDYSLDFTATNPVRARLLKRVKKKFLFWTWYDYKEVAHYIYERKGIVFKSDDREILEKIDSLNISDIQTLLIWKEI